MNTLRTAQVCVIDDEPREYLYLLSALNSLGLGCVHIRGDKIEELPEDPFRGLRLVFLDMHLGTYGGMDPRAVTAHTANVFSRVVSAESAPIVVVVWTKYAELIGSFRESLFEAFPDFRGRLFFIRMDKPVPPARIDKDKLRQDVENELGQLQHLRLLWNWDALVQRASCGVTAELCRLAAVQAQLTPGDNEDEERGKMLTAMRFVLRVLLRAEAGKGATPELAALTLLNVLGPLHSDRLETFPHIPELDSAASLLEPVEKEPTPSQEVTVALNSMLLTGSPPMLGGPFRPGTIYRIVDPDAFSAAMGISVHEMAKELCQKDILKDENAVKLQEWIDACRPVLLEVSATCDYTQQKRPLARFVGGFLVPRTISNQIKKPPEEGYSTLRVLSHVRILGLDQITDWWPVFSGGLILSWRETTVAPFLTPIARLKEPILSDLRNWLSAQGARPGYLSINSHS